MAKASSAKKASQAGAPKGRKGQLGEMLIDVAHLELKPSILMFADVERGPRSEDSSGKKEEDEYLAAVTEILQVEGFTTAVCNLRARHVVDEKSVFSVSTHYLVGFRASERLQKTAKRRVVQNLVYSAVWPRFGDLLSTFANQSGIDLPRLPTYPKITWADPTKGRSKEDE